MEPNNQLTPNESSEPIVESILEKTPNEPRRRLNLNKPFKWLWNRYSSEVKQWTNGYVMYLFILTDWIIMPVLLFTGLVSFRIENLPEYRFELLLGAFGLTASIAGLCGVQVKEKVNAELLQIRMIFMHASILLIQCTALVFLYDRLTNDDVKWWLPDLQPFGISVIKYLYGTLIGLTTILWFRAFGRLNALSWTYHYTWKYHGSESEES